MRTFLLAAALLISAPAFAQDGEDSIPVAPISSGAAKPADRPMDMFEDADTDGNGVLSKQEFLGRAEAHFKEMDMDADGLVTPDEMHALSDKRRLQMQMMLKKETPPASKE